MIFSLAMSGLGTVSLGTLLLSLGLFFLLLTLLLLRASKKMKPLQNTAPRQQISSDVPPHEDSIMLIQPGGRVIYLNQTARSKFELWEEEPNLERLARRSRPGDVFLSLCSTEGTARFSIDGRPMEGTSYFVPNGNGHNVLLSIRSQQISVFGSEDSENISETFEILTELSQAMAASLDLEVTLDAILQSIERLIPSDFSEITIWNADNQWLVPYRFFGLQGVDRHIEKTPDRYLLGEGYSGYLAKQRQFVLIPDVDSISEPRPVIDRSKYPFHAFLGVPLLVGGELIGTLELTSLSVNAFTQNDAKLLSMLSDQAAIALHNAILYQEEQKRAQELSSLATLSETVSSVRDFEELFSRLIQGITPLLDIEIAGFLIYDETRRVLQAQNPFLGIPPQFVDFYQVPIPVDSPAEAVWQKQEIVIAPDAANEQKMIDLGLDHSARAAGIRSSILVPLTSGGRSLGYLQVANKRDRTSFDQDDIRLLAIIAGQAAPIIENAGLIKLSISRALRAESLRRIASLAGSAATLDEIFKYSLLELVRLLQADFVGIFILDEDVGEIKLHPESVYGIQPDLYSNITRLPVNDETFHLTVSGTKQPILTDNAGLDSNLPTFYRTLIDNLGAVSAIDVPLITRDRSLGEILFCSTKSDFFSSSDIQLVSSVAGQLAIALERSRLASQTDESLRDRLEQLTALTRIGRELNASVHLEHLLSRVHQEALQTTQADCGTILLFDSSENEPDSLTTTLFVGDPPGDKLHALELEVIKSGAPLIIKDFGLPVDELGSEILEPAHAGVLSALVIPIAYQGNVAGIIHLHAKTVGRFNESSLEISQALALHAAIALGNTNRFQEQVRQNEILNRRVGILANLLETSQKLNVDQKLERSLEEIAYGIQSSTPFSIVLISIYDPENETLQRVAAAGIPSSAMKKLQNQLQLWSDVQDLMQENFRISNAFYIPYNQRPPMEESFHSLTLLSDKKARDNGDSAHWNPEDILIVPLISPNGNPIGLISVDAPLDNVQPDLSTIETLDMFANQARLTIESKKKLNELQQQVSSMEKRINQFGDAQDKLPLLVQKEKEQNQRIHDLLRSVQQITAGLGIFEIINRQPDRASVFSSLGNELLTKMGFDIVLIVEPTHGGPQLIFAEGDIPEDSNPEALLGQRNPLHVTLQEQELIIVPNLQEDETWMQSPLLVTMQASGFLCFPVVSVAVTEGAVLAISRSKLSTFMPEDQQLFRLLAQQTATAINNLKLLTETGNRLREVNLLLDFSRQLGILEPNRILRTLVESSLEVAQSAQGGIVALLDTDQSRLRTQVAVGYQNNTAMETITFRSSETIFGETIADGQALRLAEVEFAAHYKLDSDDLLQYREATGGLLPVSCLLVPIQSGENKLGILILENFREANAFSPEDQALVLSLTQQTALTLENARLYHNAAERAAQLQALSDVSGSLTSSLEPDDLIQSLLGALRNIVPYENGTLWLRNQNTLTIRSARGFENDADLIGISTTTEDSRLFSEMIETNQAISVANVRNDARFPGTEAKHLSWLGVPLIAKGEMVGVIALEKTEANFYAVEHIQAALTFCSQAAVALENANLYQQSLQRAIEMDQRSQRLALLNRFSNQISSILDPDFILETTMGEILHALPGSTVSAVMWESGKAVLRGESPRWETDAIIVLPNAPIFEYLEQSLGVFITQDISSEKMLAPLMPFFELRKTKSLLILPLVTGEVLHGFFFLHNHESYRYTTEEIELARIVTNQAAVAVQNASLFTETSSLTADLERRVAERTEELAHEHQRAQSLLRIMQELSASLDLDHVLNRTLSILNETINAEQSTILLVRPDEENFYYRASLGYSSPPPKGGRPSSLTLDEGLAGWVIRNRQSCLIDDIRKDERWIFLEDIENTEHRSLIAVPLMVGAEALGAILLFHRRMGAFSNEDQDLALAAAMQMAVAINNAELFKLIRDQAEGLGTMLRNQQVEASRSRAILEAVADGVLVTDSKSEITLFNNSAQEVLDLKREAVLGKSLDDFTGLFGSASKTWMETIRKWSENPASSEAGDTYAERITLDNKKVVSIHLASVVLGNEFLGTVSIFRDITHQVEVDRLKSEFVATVSHELRTPMTSIKGYVEVLLMGAAGPLSDQQSMFLDIVKSNTERLNILVNDLLDVSRIEAGKIELAIQPLDLRQIAKEVIDDQKRVSQEDNKPMSIELEIEGKLQRIPGDEERVRQILSNLVSNSYNYTPANGHIGIRIQILENCIQIDVKDDGIGIPPEDQKKIFERFYRGEDPLVLASSGTGLGLSIVQQLIEMHHGRLWLDSSGIPGEGSTFSFTLPLEQP